MKRTNALVAAPAALLAIAGNFLLGGTSYAQGWGPGYDMGPGMMGGYGGWGVLGTLFMFLWWVLIVLGIAGLVRWLFGAWRGGSASEDRALAILRERYARGEIEKNEYEARKKDLSA